jgi:hypothetical protein
MKVRHWSNHEVKDMKASDILTYEVTADVDGQLENIQRKIVVLTETLGKVIDLLPEDKQMEVLRDMFYWTPHE